MKRTAKKEAQRRHFTRRIFERYGIVANRFLVRDLKKMIQSGVWNKYFIGRESTRLSHWILPIEGKDVRVVYDSIHGEFCTALPLEDSPEYSLIKERVI